MSDGGAAVFGFLACLLFCPSEGLPLQRVEALPTLAGTRYDCAAAPRGRQLWFGRFTGHHNMSDYARTIHVEGCFPTKGECELVLDRLDGFTFGSVNRSCTLRTRPG